MVQTKTVAPVKQAAKRKTEYDPKDRRERMQGYMRSQQEIWFDFAVDASLCYHEEQWQEWTHPETNEPYSSFGECAMNEWGISYKVAMMRVAMGDAIREHSLTKEQIGTEMGWAKFHAITTAFHEDMKKSEVNTLLKAAQKKSLADLKEFVKEVKTERVGGEVEKRTTLKYVLLNEMAEVVQNAITTAIEIMGMEDKKDQDIVQGLALEYVMSEWLMNHNPKLRDKIMAQLHGEIAEDEDEEAPKPERKKSAATKKKEKTVAKKESASKTKKSADEEEFDDEEEAEEEEAPAPKAKAKAAPVKGKKVAEVDPDEFDDDEDDEDEDEFEEEE